MDAAEIETRIAQWTHDRRFTHARIAGDLLKSMWTGKIPKDGTLPGNKAIARDWGVAVSTVTRAKQLLAEHGYAKREPTGGHRYYRSQVQPRTGPRPDAAKIAAWRDSKDLAERIMADLAGQINLGHLESGTELPDPSVLQEKWGNPDIMVPIEALRRLATYPGLVVAMDSGRYFVA